MGKNIICKLNNTNIKLILNSLGAPKCSCLLHNLCILASVPTSGKHNVVHFGRPPNPKQPHMWYRAAVPRNSLRLPDKARSFTEQCEPPPFENPPAAWCKPKHADVERLLHFSLNTPVQSAEIRTRRGSGGFLKLCWFGAVSGPASEASEVHRSSIHLGELRPRWGEVQEASTTRRTNADLGTKPTQLQEGAGAPAAPFLNHRSIKVVWVCVVNHMKPYTSSHSQHVSNKSPVLQGVQA
jgi:hypothetical protein